MLIWSTQTATTVTTKDNKSLRWKSQLSPAMQRKWKKRALLLGYLATLGGTIFFFSIFSFKSDYSYAEWTPLLMEGIPKEKEAEPSFENKTEPEPQTRAQLPIKKILAWTTYLTQPEQQWKYVFARLLDKTCPVSECELIFDKRMVETADAVLFHPEDMKVSAYRLPDKHPHNQYWVFFTQESPPMISLDFVVDVGRLNNAVNWTMTYRRDSDIVAPYGKVFKKTPKQGASLPTQTRNYWKEKDPTKMAVWPTSHCKTHSRREFFVKDLSEFIKVDEYGACSELKCGHQIWEGNKFHETGNCNDIFSTYYFYLSLENAICNDYVTEKFFIPLRLGIIPIAFGGVDYKSIAPKNSYIYAFDFESPEELANYLKKVAADEELYNSYFKWREDYDVEIGYPFRPMICDLCAKLHNKPVENPPIRTNPDLQLVGKVGDTYPNLHNWYLDGGSCVSWAGPKDRINGTRTKNDHKYHLSWEHDYDQIDLREALR